jgi:CRISPR-associated endonuclease/helicase Cas3
MKNFLANKQGQSLANHSVLVGRLAESIIEKMYGQSAYGSKVGGEGAAVVLQMKRVAKLAGLLHDVGKVDQEFQSYIGTVQKAPAATIGVIEDGTQIDEAFDKKRFSFEEYPRHEEVSWMLIRRFLEKNKVQRQALPGDNAAGPNHFSRFSMLEHAVYWHHAKPLRAPESQSKKFGDAEQLAARMRDRSQWLDISAFADLRELLKQIDAVELTTLAELMCASSDECVTDAIKTPAFKAVYEDEALLLGEALKLAQGLSVEMSRTAIRSAVVSADRIVSGLTASELTEYVDLKVLPEFRIQAPDLDVIYRQLESMAGDYAERFPGHRTDRQAKAAQELAGISVKAGVACLQGPAGCGKTKIALQYLTALKQKKRIFVFVPRTAIGEALFHELVENYGVSAGVEFLSGSKKVISRSCASNANGFETIETPEGLQGTGNLVITTIDQLCKTMLSHQKIDLVTQLADSHVIFDEFHELIELPGIVLLFLEIMRLRHFSETGTLVVSATPNPQFLTLLKVQPHAVVKVDSFNTKPLAVHLTSWSPQVYAGGQKAEPHPFHTGAVVLADGAFVVCNTATVAQQASVAHRISGRNVICFHSKFTPKDKSALLRRILKVFGNESVVADELLISGPIVQASLNITTRTMHTEMCHGENALQRIGRVNRFGEMDAAAVHFYFAPGGLDPKTNSDTLANGAALSRMHQKHRTNSFYRFLTRKHAVAFQSAQSCTITLQELYSWYDEFHLTADAMAGYAEDFQSILKASAKVFSENDFDPVQYPAFIKAKGVVKLARNSLRGRSYYILPLSLRVAAAGSKGAVSLLWDQISDASQVLTDELRASGFDDRVRNKYFTWTKEAAKPATVSHVTANRGVELLKSMTKVSRALRTWPQVRGKAVVREYPILVCREKYDDDNLYYFEYDALKVGLIKAANLAKLPALKIKNSV